MRLECTAVFHPVSRLACVTSKLTCDCGNVLGPIRSFVQRGMSAPLSLPACCHLESRFHVRIDVRIENDGNRIACSLVHFASITSRLAQLVGESIGAQAARRVP